MARLAATVRDTHLLIIALGTLSLLGLGSGCSLFDNLDRFASQDAGADKSEAGTEDAASGSDMDAMAGDADAGGDAGDASASTPSGCDSPRTLCLRLQHFTPHIDELVGVDLVTADHILRARVILDPLAPDKGADADIVLPLAIPASEVPAAGEVHPLHLEIFGDHDPAHDRMYTSDGTDHDWIVELPGSGHLVFPHNQQFSRLLPRPSGIGGDFHMKFTGMSVHTGQSLEVMVIEQDSGRPVGMYRMQSIPGDAFELTIPQIIDVGGVTYRIEFYADKNGNHAYDDAPTDHTWVKFAESNATGVDFEFAHGTDFVALEYQFPFASP
jgi:hypothetical protein